jgi:hypothetical protein
METATKYSMTKQVETYLIGSDVSQNYFFRGKLILKYFTLGTITGMTMGSPTESE